MSFKQWWDWFCTQLVMFIIGLLGKFLILPIPCLLQFWTVTTGFNDKIIDKWKWEWLNFLFGNREDGVSGQCADIWNSDGSAKVPYRANTPAPIRAYLWSAWRNSCDNLKYIFADKSGKLVKFKILGIEFKAGYQMENGFNVPVLGRV